jgi:hypothetical protein
MNEKQKAIEQLRAAAECLLSYSTMDLSNGQVEELHGHAKRLKLIANQLVRGSI